MPDGFKAGSAWMSVSPDINEAEWRAKIAAAVESGSAGIGAPLGSSLSKGLRDAEAPIMDEAERIGKGAGDRIGTEAGKGIDAGIQDAIPAVRESGGKVADEAAIAITTRLRDSRGRFVTAGQDIGDGIKEPLGKSGGDSGLAFSGGFRDALDRSLNFSAVADDSLVRGIGAKGAPAGKAFSASFGTGVRDNLTGSSIASILDPSGPVGERIVEDGKKTGDKAGKAAGGAAAQGMSPLILGAFAAAATTGPAAILGATAIAVIGAGALITKGNAQVSASYQKVGTDAAKMITTATAPLVPQILASVQVLDSGIAKTGPELQSVFAAVAPMATSLTSGLVALVDNTLPGMASGLRAIAPYSGQIAADFGKLGSGLGGFFAGLGTGAAGGAAGFSALIDMASHLLADVGQITGALAGGLGPALHDVDMVAVPVAGALTDIVKAFPPEVIRAAADATLLLFGAFKLASLAGLLTEGTTFVGFLKAAAAGEIALTGETGVLATATAGLETVMAAAAGPVGLLVVGLGGLAVAGNNLSVVNAKAGNTTGDLVQLIDQMGSHLQAAGDGSRQAQQGLDGVVNTMKQLKDTGGDTTDAMTALDQQLARLSLVDPAAATSDYQRVLSDLGLTAKQGAAAFPQYTAAITDAGAAAVLAGRATGQMADQTAYALPPAVRLISALTDSQQKLAAQAAASGLASVAALSYAGNQDALNTRISASVSDYNLASGAAKAFKNAEDALYGKYASYSQAQATFTTDLANATGQLLRGRDATNLNTKAGAANFTVANQLAQANEQVAQSLIAQGGSSDDATRSLQKGAIAIDDLAKKSNFTDAQIQQLNIELYGVPTVKEITFAANTAPVIDALNATINRINDSTGTIQVYANVHNPAGGKALGAGGGGSALTNKGYASGGPVTAGSMVTVGEHQQETAVFGQDAYILTHGQTTAMQSRPQGASPAVVNFNYFGPQAPGPEQQAQMMRQLAGALA